MACGGIVWHPQLKQTNSYDSRNNLALLRLYQFYPVLMEREVVENVLMKARVVLICLPAGPSWKYIRSRARLTH